MDLIEKYLGEAQNSYLHVVYDEDEQEWEVRHSVHADPKLGGQVIKTFKGIGKGKEAEKLAMSMRKRSGNEDIIQLWKSKGKGHKVKYKNYPWVSPE